ncbi:alpha-galactosidase [Actinospica durhamensis]|uniref:Alpha-galactosidase n=1 Tax=Actinospica durhamensis TaxID=1508375 RepID=A0A941EVG4_9ACTN|nr:alpha-galactosidase [Actinospica durhamensis]MBR7837696.1 alpha-galactosidase [Actinospica durhamensis]
MALVTHVAEHRLWVLTAAQSCYVLHLDSDDLLRTAHWGRALTAAQAVSLLDYAPPRPRSCEDARDGLLDLDPDGGLRYGHAGLQVRFADGTRDLELSFTGAHVLQDEPDGAAAELVLCFADAHYPLSVNAHYRVRRDTPAIERWLTLRHTGPVGGAPISVVRADCACWVLPELEDYRLSHAHGQWAAEGTVQRSTLAYGETVLGSRRGVTGHQAGPWAMVDAGSATEEHGAVYGAALAWSGSWQLVAQRLPSGRASLSLGAGHTPAAFDLAADTQYVTPSSLGIYTEGGFGAASRAWQDYVRRYVLPHPDELRPVLYNSWEATEFDVTLKGQMALAERAAAIGVELFVMDDGWFGARTSDAAGLGDWYPNPERFPDGLTPLIEHVHGLGMRFGLWIEPEMANPDSDLYRAHPDWIVHRPHRTRTRQRGQHVLNLALPQVADQVHQAIDTLLRENAIDFLKWDMNRSLTEVGPLDGRTDDGLWFDYVTHLYRILDRLRADHPALRIECCASGGARLDLGILARTDQVWASDNTDAADRRHIQHGYTQIHPAGTMGAWITDSPNPFTGRRTPLEYRFHVAAAGVLGIGLDLSALDEEELARVGELVAAYKRVRPVVQHGRQYRLGGPDQALHAVQFLADAVMNTDTAATNAPAAEIVVLVYRDARRHGQLEPPLPLRDLDPQALYRDAATGREHHGAVLLARGLPLEDLPAGDHASTLIHLRRVGTQESEVEPPTSHDGVSE